MAPANLLSFHSLESFIRGILQQLASLLGGTQDAAYLTSAVVGTKPVEQYNSSKLFLYTGKGENANTVGKRLEQVVDSKELISCQQAYVNKYIIFEDECLKAYCGGKTKEGSLLYIFGLPIKWTKQDENLVDMFSRNVRLAFDNVLLKRC